MNRISFFQTIAHTFTTLWRRAVFNGYSGVKKGQASAFSNPSSEPGALNVYLKEEFCITKSYCVLKRSNSVYFAAILGHSGGFFVFNLQ